MKEMDKVERALDSAILEAADAMALACQRVGEAFGAFGESASSEMQAEALRLAAAKAPEAGAKLVCSPCDAHAALAAMAGVAEAINAADEFRDFSRLGERGAPPSGAAAQLEFIGAHARNINELRARIDQIRQAINVAKLFARPSAGDEPAPVAAAEESD